MVQLPCSQDPANGPYPGPEESSPQLTTFISLRSIQISSHLWLGLMSSLLPSAFLMKSLHTFLMT
jgi:hypothetical protein